MIAAAMLALVCALGAPAGAASQGVAVRPESASQTIVLLGVDGPDAAERAEAISAHVHGLATLVASAARPAVDDPGAWYELAAREARERSAVAVFWVEADGDHYVLSVVRPERREVRWRRIDVDSASPSAGIEALGVITRATTSALLADSALQMETTPIPEPKPEVARSTERAPTPAPTRRRERGRALLAASYTGTSYAREIAWQSGVGVEAGWAWPIGLRTSIGYTVYQRARAQSSLGRLELVRHPIAVMVGYHRRVRAIGFGGDAGLLLDYTRRHATTTEPDVEAGADRGRVTTALALRARGSVLVVWRLEVFAALGVEAWLSDVRYAVRERNGELGVVLTPRRVRATGTAGVAVRL